MSALTYNIAAVERDTGLSKDVLRMWERRYGFPIPERDANGDRAYTAEQVERLRLIKRLMDMGHRPGKLIATPYEELAALAPRRAAASPAVPDDRQAEIVGLVESIRRHDAGSYVQALQQGLARQGLQRFVQDTIAPLAHRIGEGWEQGSIEVFEEHLFTELTKRVLRQAIAALPAGDRQPRILLTTLPGEQHMLGLLMAEALLALEGGDCIPLGTQMPIQDICRAAEAHRADIVALSFSAAFPSRQLDGLMQQLRSVLPQEVGLWVGGSGVLRISPPTGVRQFTTLAEVVDALAEWKQEHPASG
jgi:methanogenic corrinoid protein MtbC1